MYGSKVITVFSFYKSPGCQIYDISTCVIILQVYSYNPINPRSKILLSMCYEAQSFGIRLMFFKEFV